MKDFENFPFCRSADSINIYYPPFGVFTRISLLLNVSRYVEHLPSLVTLIQTKCLPLFLSCSSIFLHHELSILFGESSSC